MQMEIVWPKKCNILGVNISPIIYEEASDLVIKAAKNNNRATVTHLAVHGVVEAAKNHQFNSMLEKFQIVAPDGQPVRMLMNRIHKVALPDRCYGPEFMIRVCKKAAQEGVCVYLYGSFQGVVDKLRDNLIHQFPRLRIVGAEPSLFRALTKTEDEEFVCRVNLGCPLQERFAYAHRDRIQAVQICVGAAFDFHSRNKKMAPSWMQKCSLEWFYRLLQEPMRLSKRYLTTNTVFLLKTILYLSGIKKCGNNSRGSGGCK
jgi:exopolysaccharide biosynthesis WecB/TagA/CpsF family protein